MTFLMDEPGAVSYIESANTNGSGIPMLAKPERLIKQHSFCKFGYPSTALSSPKVT